MPLEELDMDKVFDLGCKKFLKKMQKRKFYMISHSRPSLRLSLQIFRPMERLHV